MPPRITVVTPSLNQAAFLDAATIRSSLSTRIARTRVPDSSTAARPEGSAEILRRYDDRIAYWESVPDRGQSHAINKGLERATGEIVGWINSDDYYLPGVLAITTEDLRGANPSAEWVCGACRYLHADGSPPWSACPGCRAGRGPLGTRPVVRAPGVVVWRRTALERAG